MTTWVLCFEIPLFLKWFDDDPSSMYSMSLFRTPLTALAAGEAVQAAAAAEEAVD